MVLTPGGIKFTPTCRFWSLLFTQEINIKEETFGIISSSTSRDDHEARHKSRHITNMNPKGPGTEAWSRETPGTWTEDVEACTTRSSVQTVEKTTSRAHMHKGASQQLIEEHRGARLGQTGADRPNLFQVRFVPPPLCPRCLSIYCLYLRRPPHPSIHQRATETKEKHREEADGRRKSLSWLGYGLGHALAAMVGPAWWSHGGVPESRLEFVKSFVPSPLTLPFVHRLLNARTYMLSTIDNLCIYLSINNMATRRTT
jgi:hypothetical protein